MLTFINLAYTSTYTININNNDYNINIPCNLEDLKEPRPIVTFVGEGHDLEDNPNLYTRNESALYIELAKKGRLFYGKEGKLFSDDQSQKNIFGIEDSNESILDVGVLSDGYINICEKESALKRIGVGKDSTFYDLTFLYAKLLGSYAENMKETQNEWGYISEKSKDKTTDIKTAQNIIDDLKKSTLSGIISLKEQAPKDTHNIIDKIVASPENRSISDELVITYRNTKMIENIFTHYCSNIKSNKNYFIKIGAAHLDEFYNMINNSKLKNLIPIKFRLVGTTISDHFDFSSIPSSKYLTHISTKDIDSKLRSDALLYAQYFSSQKEQSEQDKKIYLQKLKTSKIEDNKEIVDNYKKFKIFFNEELKRLKSVPINENDIVGLPK